MRRLLIFLKYPTPGQVKTRLASTVGPQAAAEISRACTELTLERLGMLRQDCVLCVDPHDAVGRTREWLGASWTMQPQRGAMLGERLADATQRAFAEGSTRVVVIGTDSPWLAAEDIERAFDALVSHEGVIGPTEDGGYYLIGLSRPAPLLFEGITWSTPSVYVDSLAKARTLGLRMHELRIGYDIDRVEELQRFIAEERARGNRSRLMETIETLSHAHVSPRREPCPS